MYRLLNILPDVQDKYAVLLWQGISQQEKRNLDFDYERPLQTLMAALQHRTFQMISATCFNPFHSAPGGLTSSKLTASHRAAHYTNIV